jgi:hypothetical protein
MLPNLLFAALLSVSLSSPTLGQVIAEPPIGSSQARAHMPKAADIVPDRVRTYDPEVTGGIKVRSDLADKPEELTPRPEPR